jgi:hypothetical protein
MTEHPQPHPEPRSIERAIVLQLLRDGHDERWSRAELEAEVNDVEPSVHFAALAAGGAGLGVWGACRTVRSWWPGSCLVVVLGGG